MAAIEPRKTHFRSVIAQSRELPLGKVAENPHQRNYSEQLGSLAAKPTAHEEYKAALLRAEAEA